MAELTTSGNSGKKGRRRPSTPRIDLTAMVDLAFLLITFFIMATTLAKPKAMELAKPVKEHPEPVPETRTMSVCLGKDNKVMWYVGMPEKPLTAPKLVDFSKTGLRAALITKNKELLKSSGKLIIVILKPSDHSVYSNFVTALDELNITGIQTYAVADITPKDVDMLKQQGAF
ncbi:MAG: biopolymer transporter ExbD [Bacteroidetes bacterium]|jgi:biopolymer transport protein ExbD|nr:biopolymer transporter ExbD [Bacteroidota bacterium]